jgi:PleD family two-component response regulator
LPRKNIRTTKTAKAEQGFRQTIGQWLVRQATPSVIRAPPSQAEVAALQGRQAHTKRGYVKPLVERKWAGSDDEPRMSVLVVDADSAARERVQAALDTRFTLHFAHGLREALAAVAEIRPDLLISEVDLADGDGFQLCRRLRAQPDMRRLPILLLTNRTNTADKVEGFQAGADDYVVKPLDARLFHARLRLLSRIKRVEPPSLFGS